MDLPATVTPAIDDSTNANRDMSAPATLQADSNTSPNQATTQRKDDGGSLSATAMTPVNADKTSPQDTSATTTLQSGLNTNPNQTTTQRVEDGDKSSVGDTKKGETPAKKSKKGKW